MPYNIRLKDTVETFTKELFFFLFDSNNADGQIETLENDFLKISKEFLVEEPQMYWKSFKEKLLPIRQKLDIDAQFFVENDPANKSLEEVYLAYPGFYAIAIYRLSHELELLSVPILPRMMSEYAHGVTGTDIHPGADIGSPFFIDHATGVVIGETTVIKNNVKIFQGVTLGGLQVDKNLASFKRHPTIQDNVTIYANATILGGEVVIGANSIIGANVCLTESISENSIITYKKEYKIRAKESVTR